MVDLLLLMGPPGVGKSATIRSLVAVGVCSYVAPVTTRPLRPQECDKQSVSSEAYTALVATGEVIVDNEIHGYRYGTMKASLTKARESGKVPVIDWPVDRLEDIQKVFPGFILSIYLRPSNAESLIRRLRHRGGPGGLERSEACMAELQELSQGRYGEIVDVEIAVHEGQPQDVVQAVIDVLRSVRVPDPHTGGQTACG